MLPTLTHPCLPHACRGDVAPAASCASGAEQGNLHALIATSFFKMSKSYSTNSNGQEVNLAKWDIRPQPCQVRS